MVKLAEDLLACQLICSTGAEYKGDELDKLYLAIDMLVDLEDDKNREIIESIILRLHSIAMQL